MSAYVVFSNNHNRFGSKLISYGSIKEGSIEAIPSHMSYVFFNTYVYESRLESGVDINEFGEFLNENKVIAIFDVGKTVVDPDKFYAHIFRSTYKKKYDWKAILYLATIQFKWKFLDIEKPSVNPWNSKDKFYCNELYSYIEPGDLSTVTPYELMNKMKGKYPEIRIDDLMADMELQ